MRSNSNRTLLPAVLAALCALGLGTAHAEEVIYGPDGAPTVVQRKLHPITGKWEVGAEFNTALNTALVNHNGVLVTVANHPNEWLDLGVDLMGNVTSLSGLSDQIREKLPARADATTNRPNTGDEISKADQVVFAGAFRARLAPVYGKLDFASEFKVHFQAFLLAGVGGAYLVHESVNLCATAGRTPCTEGNYQERSNFTVAGEFGAGFRFYLGDSWSLGLAIRVFLYPAKIIEGADLTNPASGTETTYLGNIQSLNIGFARLF